MSQSWDAAPCIVPYERVTSCVIDKFMCLIFDIFANVTIY
jgi:hypothetical protein